MTSSLCTSKLFLYCTPNKEISSEQLQTIKFQFCSPNRNSTHTINYYTHNVFVCVSMIVKNFTHTLYSYIYATDARNNLKKKIKSIRF